MEEKSSGTAQQLKWIGRFALIFIVSSFFLLIFLRKLLYRELGSDYTQAFRNLKDLDASLLLAVGIPVGVYLFVVSLLVITVKLFFSHTIAGPIFRLETCARSLEKGDLSFYSQVRKGDQLKKLAAAVSELKEDVRAPIVAAGRSADAIETLAKDLESTDDAETTLKHLEAELETLNNTLDDKDGVSP